MLLKCSLMMVKCSSMMVNEQFTIINEHFTIINEHFTIIRGVDSTMSIQISTIRDSNCRWASLLCITPPKRYYHLPFFNLPGLQKPGRNHFPKNSHWGITYLGILVSQINLWTNSLITDDLFLWKVLNGNFWFWFIEREVTSLHISIKSFTFSIFIHIHTWT